MAIERDGVAPYAPPKAVIEFVERYRDRGLATPVTVDVLLRAGIPDSLAPRTLQGLKLLDILNDDGRTTEQFETLARAPDSEFKERLGEHLCAVYADVISFADPSTDDDQRVSDAFRGYTPRGQRERMVTLFLGLLEYAGVDITAAKTTRRARPVATPGAAPRRRANGPQRESQQRGSARRQQGGGSGSSIDLPAPLMGLLSSLPTEGGWTQETRDKFVTTFSAVLDFCVPVVQAITNDPTEGNTGLEE